MSLNGSKSLHKADDKILTETNYWLMRIKAGEMTTASEIKFHKWLAADPKHQAEFDMMNAVWDGADVYLKDPVALGDLNEALNGKASAPRQRLFSGFSLNFSMPRLAAVAVTVLLLLTGLWSIRYHEGKPTIYFTNTGIQKMVKLPDGSSAFLDSETTLSVQFSDNSRRIDLKKGRAMFSVTHDPDHPFVVSSNNITVRALGTQFDVYKATGNRISVSVTEGSVQVDLKDTEKSGAAHRAPGASAGQTDTDLEPGPEGNTGNLSLAGTVLASGQGMTIDENSNTYEIRPIDEQRHNSWIDGRLYFYMTPLSEVIEEVNRYLDSKIVIGDSRLKDLPISLNFDINQKDSFLPTLRSATSIEVKRTTDGKYVLLSRE